MGATFSLGELRALGAVASKAPLVRCGDSHSFECLYCVSAVGCCMREDEFRHKTDCPWTGTRAMAIALGAIAEFEEEQRQKRIAKEEADNAEVVRSERAEMERLMAKYLPPDKR